MKKTTDTSLSDLKRRLPEDRIALILTFQAAAASGETPSAVLANIFATYLFPQRGNLLNVPLFISSAQKVFGEDFTELSAQVVISILCEHGFLTRDTETHDGVLYRVSQEIELLSGNGEQSLWDQFGDITEAFWQFFEAKAESLPLVGEDRTAWEADLFLWLTSEDQSSRKRLIEGVDKLIAGKALDDALDAREDEPLYTSIDRYRLFRFAQFIRYLRSNDAEIANKVVAFAEAGFVFRVVRGFGSAPKIDPGSHELQLVLDGPVLIDLLGLSGPLREEATQRIVRLAESVGIKCMTLTHCVEEAVEVISTIINKPRADRWGLTGDALRKDPGLETRFRTFINMPDKLVEQAGVAIANFDKTAFPNQHGYFSSDLIDEFTSKAHFGGFNSTPIRRQRDAHSFAFVARRRGAIYRSDLFKSKYVLVTQNAMYASMADRFVKNFLTEVPKFAAPYVIEVSVLAAMLWLRVPSQDVKALPELSLFATCQRLLASTGDILKKAQQKLSSGATEDEAAQYELLLADPLAVEELMVRNAKSPISSSDPDEVRSLVRAAAIEAEKRKYQSQRRQLTAAHKDQVTQLSEEVKSAEIRAKKAEDEAANAQKRNAEILEKERAKLAAMPRSAERTFDIWNAILFGLATVVSVVGWLGFKEHLAWNWLALLPFAFVMLISAAFRAPLVGASLRERFVASWTRRRQSNHLSSIASDWVRAEMEQEFPAANRSPARVPKVEDVQRG